MKEALVKHSGDGVVKAVDELLGFLVEMIREDYPHTHTQVCKTFDQSKAQWTDLERIMKAEKDKETTL